MVNGALGFKVWSALLTIDNSPLTNTVAKVDYKIKHYEQKEF